MNRARLRFLLEEYRKGLSALFGEEVSDVILYGSEARGQAHQGSDVDVLIVLKHPFDYASMIHLTSELTAGLSLSYDCVLSRAFVTSQEYRDRNTPFLMNVRREGVAV